MALPKTQETAYRNTPEGDALYCKWKRMASEGRAQCWSRFGAFYEWAKGEGYCKGDNILRIDESLPWGPDNAYVREYGLDLVYRIGRNKDFIARWNKTVNRIRAHYGLPLF
jgi:hypothetical protein